MNNNLKKLRERLGLNQKEFAASMGIGHTTYNGYETGARDPKSDFWIAVSEKYNVSIDYLLCCTDNPEITGVRSISNEKPASTTRSELIELVISLSDEEVEYILDLVQRLLHVKPQ